MQALFPPEAYLHDPSLGSLEYSAHDFSGTAPVIDFRSGLAEVTAQMTGQDVVVLCDCPGPSRRCHRRLVARELAAALGLDDAMTAPRPSHWATLAGWLQLTEAQAGKLWRIVTASRDPVVRSWCLALAYFHCPPGDRASGCGLFARRYACTA